MIASSITRSSVRRVPTPIAETTTEPAIEPLLAVEEEADEPAQASEDTEPQEQPEGL